jgi:hypothetical protein
MTKNFTFICFLVAVLGTFGCSRNVPLSGTVTFSDDGSPAPRGMVVFSTPTFVAQGPIQPDGTYRVSSTGVNDGLPRGTYGIAVVAVNEITYTPGIEGRMNEHQTPLIDPKYEDATTSGLTFTVDGKTRTFNIPVDRAR